MFLFFRARRENMEMVKWIENLSLLLKRLKDSWMDMLLTTDRYVLQRSESRRQNQSHADMACGSEERRSRSQEPLSPDLPETRERRNATQLAAHERLFPVTDNLTTLMFTGGSDLCENQRERFPSSLSFQGMDVTTYTFNRVKVAFGWIVLFTGKPNCAEILQFVQNLHKRKWFWGRIWILGNRCSNWRAGLCWRQTFMLLVMGRQSVCTEIQTIQEPLVEEEKSRRQRKCRRQRKSLFTDGIFSSWIIFWRGPWYSLEIRRLVLQLLWGFWFSLQRHHCVAQVKIFSVDDVSYLESCPPSDARCFGSLVGHDRLAQEKQSGGSRNIRRIMALQQNSVLALSVLCLPTLKQKLVWESCIIHFPTKPPCSTWVDVLETGDVPIYPILPSADEESGYYTWTGSKRS